jgi:hypothetical protein
MSENVYTYIRIFAQPWCDTVAGALVTFVSVSTPRAIATQQSMLTETKGKRTSVVQGHHTNPHRTEHFHTFTHNNNTRARRRNVQNVFKQSLDDRHTVERALSVLSQ